MASFLGRSIALTWGGSAMAGVRERKISGAGSPVDISSGEDNGFRTLLATPGRKELNLSLSGITKSSAFRDDFHAGTTTKTAVLTYPDGSTITGSFFMASYNETGPYEDATTFDMELQSTGAWVYTPPA